MSLPTVPPPAPTPATVPRTVRVPAELWAATIELAARDGLSVSDVVRHYLRAYVESIQLDHSAGMAKAQRPRD